nr:hypothetical protein [Corynebacterium lactis]
MTNSDPSSIPAEHAPTKIMSAAKSAASRAKSKLYYLPVLPWGPVLNMPHRLWWPVVAVIGLIQLVGRTFILTGRSFYWDDFIVVGHLYDSPILSSGFLLQDHDGHLAPLSFLVQGIVATLAPWNWWIPAIVLLTLAGLLTVACAKLLEHITGRTWASAFLLAVIAWTPLGIPGGTWWSAGINALPFHLAFVVFLTIAIRTTLRRDFPPKPINYIGALLILVIALGFFEKALAIAPVSLLLVATMAYMERRDVKAILRRGISIWLPSMLVTGGWALWYYFGVPHTVSHASDNLKPELFFNGLGQIFSGMVGGPGQWERWMPGQPFADASAGLITVGGITLLVLSAILIGRDYRGWAPWAVAVAYIFATLLAITIFRSGENTSGMLAHTLHYYSDVAIVIVVSIAMSCAGTPPENEAPVPLPKRTRSMLWLLGAVLAVSSSISVVTYRAAWADDTTAKWLDTTQRSLAALQAEAAQAGPAKALDYNLIDQPVPFEVLLPVAAPTNMYSHVFDKVEARPPFSRITGTPRMFGSDGAIIDAKVSEVTRVQDGPVEQCGHRIVVGDNGSVQVDIPMSGIIKLGDWVLEFPATASENMDVRLSLPNPFETEEQTRAGSTVVPMTTELRPRYVNLNGGGNVLRVTIDRATPGASLCMGAGAIGPLVPAKL